MRPHTHQALKRFVGPYYAERDVMHDYAHVVRILETARALGDDGPALDEDLLVVGAHLHGVIARDEPAVRDFLAELGFDGERIDEIIQVAYESLKEREPLSPEGAVLHDAHLTEGGPAFSVIKALITGRERGGTDLETAAFLRDRVLGRYHCATPTGRAWYAENQAYIQYFLNRLAARLAREEGSPDFPEGPDPYAGGPTVSLACPWCDEDVSMPECLLGNDVLCPECSDVIYLAPALGAGAPVRAEPSDLQRVPPAPRCPRCRSRASWRRPTGLVGWVFIILAGYWLYASLKGTHLIHAYADPLFAALGLAAGVDLAFRRAAYRCAACGHKWK